MGLKLIHNSNSILKSNKEAPKLYLIHGEKDVPQLWPSDLQPIPLPKIIEKPMICSKCGESEEYAWINSRVIHCYTCSLTTIQRFDVFKD